MRPITLSNSHPKCKGWGWPDGDFFGKEKCNLDIHSHTAKEITQQQDSIFKERNQTYPNPK
ncbi:hypothetical protein FH972_008294 [Carpinus fangiana]|uniref:Uncharacterized protein n=1 Tax=Carpinus fangiana TaxID=176857 RepID=A0A5N6R1B1_9ROSI|nr:hypothetical protein FH972_008294 [Carpinus fangiana]